MQKLCTRAATLATRSVRRLPFCCALPLPQQCVRHRTSSHCHACPLLTHQHCCSLRLPLLLPLRIATDPATALLAHTPLRCLPLYSHSNYRKRDRMHAGTPPRNSQAFACCQSHCCPHLRCCQALHVAAMEVATPLGLRGDTQTRDSSHSTFQSTAHCSVSHQLHALTHKFIIHLRSSNLPAPRRQLCVPRRCSTPA